MAALIEGQQYGLSAQNKINSNKSIVFVKLTDSALRSIEEYVKNKGGADTKPTIQFKNSNGFLSLPQNGTNQTYGFTLSNVEADGPQGSFECLRQIGHRSLESLGCMHMKMHIHANEDSYENTRVKMAAVEKEKNKSCTKVIKPAGAHLGRKVKVKRPGLVVNPVKPHSPPSVPIVNKTPLSHPKPLNNSMNNVSNSSTNNILPKKLPDVSRYQKPIPKSKFNSSPELLRQPIRDRIIHILAVRPYKRPELMVRLMSEGIRDKDKKGISAILSQVGVLKGNVYNLANYCWNEVQDNWKFATQDEMEIIQKRKQQYLIANAASESPPMPSLPSSSPVQKRLASENISVGQEPRAKKQRISHYSRTDNYNPSVKTDFSDSSERLHLTTTTMNRKSACSPNFSRTDQEFSISPKSPTSNSCDGFSKKQRVSNFNRTDTFNHSSKRETTSDSNEKLHFTTSNSVNRVSSYSPVSGVTNGTSQENEHSPKSPENSCDGFSNSNSNLSQRNSLSNYLDEKLSSSSLRHASREDAEKSIRKHTSGLGQQNGRRSEKPLQKPQLPAKKYDPDESSQKHSSSHSKSVVNSDTGKSSSYHKALSQARLSNCEPVAQVSPDSNTQFESKELKSDPCSKIVVNGYVNNNNNNSIKLNSYSNNQSSYVNRPKVTSTTNGSCSTSPHSPESCSDSNDSTCANSPIHVHINLPPDTPESDNELPDYISKYTRIKSREQRTRYKDDFNAQYQEYRLLHTTIEKIKTKFISLNRKLSNYKEGSEEFIEISSEIIEEYRAYHQDENYKKSEEKLHYLHSKLSHIKKLVMEYDKDYVKS